MDDKKNKIKSFLEEIREELQAHNITYEQVALETKVQGLNADRGYTVEKVKNVLIGRVACQSDITAVAVGLIENSMKILEKLADNDVTPLITRLKRSKVRRVELEVQWQVA